MSYWEDRTRQNVQKTIKLADTYCAREKAALKNVQMKIRASLNELLAEINSGEALSRTQLWESKKYIALRNAIEQQLTGHAVTTVELVDALLADAFEASIGQAMEDFPSVPWISLSDGLRREVLNTEWNGTNYSTRIWHNNKAMVDRLEEDITTMILRGDSYAKISKQFANDFHTAYKVAERLIRTESAHVHVEMAKKTYEAAGVTEVKYLHGGHCHGNNCDCDDLEGKIFPIHAAPLLPRHPFVSALLLQWSTRAQKPTLTLDLLPPMWYN